MGTRSLTVFVHEDDKREIVVMYRQFDGYIDYYGKRLCDYLQSFDEVVNGIGPKDYVRKTANGMSCLAAQAIMHFKSKIKNHDYNNRVFNPETGLVESAVVEGNHTGGIYLFPAGTRDCGEEYIYIVKKSKKGLVLEAYKAGHKAWTSREGKEFPAVADELIHKGLVSDNWFEQALKAEKIIHDRKEAEWKAQQEMKQ